MNKDKRFEEQEIVAPGGRANHLLKGRLQMLTPIKQRRPSIINPVP